MPSRSWDEWRLLEAVGEEGRTLAAGVCGVGVSAVAAQVTAFSWPSDGICGEGGMEATWWWIWKD